MTSSGRFRIASILLGTVLIAAGCTTAGPTTAPTAAPTSAATGAATSGPTAAATPQVDKTPVQVGWGSTPDIGYLPLLMAIDDMKAQGFAISTVSIAGGDTALQALIQNTIQFGIFGGTTAGVAAILKGAPIKGITTRAANEAVWVAQNQYADCNTLNGKPVGVFAMVSNFTSQMEAYFASKCPSVKPTYLVISDSPARATALGTGNIVATVLGLPDAVKLNQDNPGKYTLTFFGETLPGLADVYFWSNDQTISGRPIIVQALIKAQLNAIRGLYKNPSSLAAAATKHNVPSTAADRYLTQKLWYANGGLSGKGLEDTLTLFKLGGTRAQILDERPMTQVLAEIGRDTATER